MLLLVSVRHVGAHLDELQHCVSIQSSMNLGKTFPRISRIRIIPSTQILGRVFVYLPPFISQILEFICRILLIFILICFVSKTLTFKVRLGAQPFLWKWVLFAWEWKMISISKAEHLPSFWIRGPGELGNGLFSLAISSYPSARFIRYCSSLRSFWTLWSRT